MSISIEQLEVLSKALHGPELDYHQMSITGEAVRALDMEIDRRKHGPFMLAEAIASGRPFKRKAWTPGRVALRMENEAVGLGDGYVMHGVKLVIAHDRLDDGRVAADDITATDYELAEEVTK